MSTGGLITTTVNQVKLFVNLHLVGYSMASFRQGAEKEAITQFSLIHEPIPTIR